MSCLFDRTSWSFGVSQQCFAVLQNVLIEIYCILVLRYCLKIILVIKKYHIYQNHCDKGLEINEQVNSLKKFFLISLVGSFHMWKSMHNAHIFCIKQNVFHRLYVKHQKDEFSNVWLTVLHSVNELLDATADVNVMYAEGVSLLLLT